MSNVHNLFERPSPTNAAVRSRNAERLLTDHKLSTLRFSSEVVKELPRNVVPCNEEIF